jgi:hypothetical protein
MYLKKEISKKLLLLTSWRSLTKKAGSGSESISQRYGSADPDPYQDFMVPQHWKKPWNRGRPTINTEDQTHVPVPVPYHIRQIAEKKICIYKHHHYFNVVMPHLAFIQSKVIILYLYRSCEFRSRWHNYRIRNKRQTYFVLRIRMSNIRNLCLVMNPTTNQSKSRLLTFVIHINILKHVHKFILWV